VRVRRLYYDPEIPEECYAGGTFPPLIQPQELRHSLNKMKRHLHDHTGSAEVVAEFNQPRPREIVEALLDLAWCDSIVFLYPTWWSTYPAILKGFFDRILLPGIEFTVQGGGEDIMESPLLSHITKLAVVTTYSRSWWETFLAGDIGRRWISTSLRAFCALDCTLLWQGIYLTDAIPPKGEKNHLPTSIYETKEMFKSF
jgi:putative NADPH-quinone reductase